MYARTVGDQVLTFGVSGMLYRDALVMYDRETDSLWTHVDGRAIKGPFAGRVLTPLASTLATWDEWKAMYPDSVVMKKRGEFRSSYEDYNRDPGKLGIMGRRNPDPRLPGKARIVGLRAGDVVKAYPLDRLRGAGIVQDDVGDLRAVLVAVENLPVVAYDRRIQGRTLTFTVSAGTPLALKDEQTATTWRLSDGAAVAGPLAGGVSPAS